MIDKIDKDEEAPVYALRHPLNDAPAVATLQDYWRSDGRAIGLVLLFPGGHLASLTFAEIRELQGGDSLEN